MLNRLITLISDHARLLLSNEASLAQARSATEAAQRLMAGTGDASDVDQVCYTDCNCLHHYLNNEAALKLCFV